MTITLSGWGCSKKAAENAAERAFERATNGQADVDIGTNSITINTNAGSFQAGGNVTLPDGFPSDVYVVDGTLTSATTSASNSGFTLSAETTKSVNEVKALYEEQLKNEGWTISLTMSYENSASVGAQKDNRTTTVSIAQQEENGKTLVVLTTSTNDYAQ